MKYLLYILCFITIGFSDSAPMFLMQGGNVIPVSNNDIQLQSEQIDIYVKDFEVQDDYTYKVKVTYNFVNHGEAQQVTMGFPNAEGGFTHTLANFKAWVNGKAKKITRRSLDKSGASYAIDYAQYYGLTSHYDYYNEDKYAYREVYECFSVSFKKGERKQVVNTYRSQSLINDEISYILKTGALWKDRIEDVKVVVHFDKESGWNLGFLKPYYAYRFRRIRPGYHHKFLPQQYEIKDNKILMHFKDIEPEFDIYLDMADIRDQWYESASSEMDNYPITNVLDNNLSTAWVEDDPKSGIGEYISFDLGDSIMVNKLAIYAGYGKSKKTYHENNRLKQVRVETTGKGRQFTKSYFLKDTMGMQYLNFDYPVCLGSVKVTIEEVYKGSKYDDTPISELHIIPAKAGEFVWSAFELDTDSSSYQARNAVDGNAATAWVEENSHIKIDSFINYGDTTSDTFYQSSVFSLSQSNSDDHQLPAIIDSIGIIYGTFPLHSDSLKPRFVSTSLIEEDFHKLEATDSMQYIKLSEPQFVENINLFFHKGPQKAAIHEIKTFKSNLTVVGDFTVPSKGDRYSPMNVVDGDPNTAWASDPHTCDYDSDYDCGELGLLIYHPSLWVTVSNAKDHQLPAKINKIGIIGGYAKSKKVYLNNERIRDLTLTLYPSREEYEYTLKDTMAMQYLDIPKPQMVKAYQLTINSTYEGKGKDSDITISEVQTFTK